MNYLERYLNGERQQVWNELVDLGPQVRQEPYLSQATEVTAETMRRVRRNCERLVSRLNALGYIFGTYPDGCGSFTSGALVLPDEASFSSLAELETRCGPLPLSLLGFWQEVGSVDFVGMHPTWPKALDPLVVGDPGVALLDLDEWEELIEDGEVEASDVFEASLSPDDLHKDNISGGAPYSVALPSRGADFVFLYEHHELPFVSYLRLAILRCGGFPGLEGQNVEFEHLTVLTQGLEPF